MASRVGAEAVNQNDRRALAVILVMNSHSVGIEEWHPQTSRHWFYILSLARRKKPHSIMTRHDGCLAACR
jgi:hypothetical protein